MNCENSLRFSLYCLFVLSALVHSSLYQYFNAGDVISFTLEVISFGGLLYEKQPALLRLHNFVQ